MTEREVDRVEEFFRRIRRHPHLALLVIAGIIFLTLAGLISSFSTVYNTFRSEDRPRIEALFLDGVDATKTLRVEPEWAGSVRTGYSNVIPITVALRNIGSASASSVRVHLAYPPGVLSLENGSGNPEPPGVLNNMFNITETGSAQSFRIDQLNVSPVLEPFEKKLEIRLRFRDVVGIPIFSDDVFLVLPLSAAFTNTDANDLGRFPIYYVIDYEETNTPESGILFLDIGNISDTEAGAVHDDITLNMIVESTELDLPTPSISVSKKVHFFNGPMSEAYHWALSEREFDSSAFVEADVSESANENMSWMVISAPDRLTCIYLDKDKDGDLDAIYIEAGEDKWVQLEPSRATDYLSLAKIVDLAKPESMINKLADAIKEVQ